MRRLTERLVEKILPKATGKAAVADGRCHHGCGSDGVYIPTRGYKPGDKLPCC